MGFFSRKTTPPASPPTPPPTAIPDRLIKRSDLEALLEDLRSGAEFQNSLLPQEAPNVTGYDVGFVYQAARQLSGDTYDFVAMQDGKLGLAIADASGKGVTASLVSVTCRILLRVLPEPEASPAEVLGQLNRLLLPNIKRGMFVSAIYAVLDPVEHTLTVANAGHLPVVVARPFGGDPDTYPSRGSVLGVLPPDRFAESMQEEVIPLTPGDRFIFITDGVNEAMAPGDKEFGMQHLLRVLQKMGDAPSDQVLKELMAYIELHRGGGEQSDDITIVSGRRKPI